MVTVLQNSHLQHLRSSTWNDHFSLFLVFNELQAIYAQAHDTYDQAHGSHRKTILINHLQSVSCRFSTPVENLLWLWKPYGFGSWLWLLVYGSMCLPIKIPQNHVLDRKSLAPTPPPVYNIKAGAYFKTSELYD